MTKTEPGRVYVANETFAGEIDGETVIVHKGVTRIRHNHPIWKKYKAHFDLADEKLEYDLEEATPSRRTRVAS